MINRYSSLRQGLVGAWCPSLGASGYQLIDRSGYGNHGTLTNMEPGTDWAPSGGKLALDFDGDNDRVVIADNDIFSPTDGTNDLAMSVSAWVYYRSSGGPTPFAPIIGKYDSISPFTGEWLLSVGSSRDVSMQLLRASTSNRIIRTSSTAVIETNAWSHIVAVYDASKSATGITLYLNGSVVSSTGSATYAGTTNKTGRVAIGSALYDGGDTNFRGILNGLIDDARVWIGRQLNATDVKLLYTGGPGVGIIPERIKHRRKTLTTARSRNYLVGAY